MTERVSDRLDALGCFYETQMVRVPPQHTKRLVDMSHTLMRKEQSSLVLNQ